jgi:hypothetical protein
MDEYGKVARHRTVAATLAAIALIAAALTIFAFPPSARADCGGTLSEAARPTAPHRLPPVAIGDSTLLLSLPYLQREHISANARGCRQYSEGLWVIQTLAAAHRLPGLVIVTLGANGNVTNDDITQALRLLGPRRTLAMVTHYEPHLQPGPDTALIRSAPRRHPRRIVVLDWITYSAHHPGWFQPDGLHLTYPGAAAYAHFLAGAVPLSARTGALSATTPPARRARAHADTSPSATHVAAILASGAWLWLIELGLAVAIWRLFVPRSPEPRRTGRTGANYAMIARVAVITFLFLILTVTLWPVAMSELLLVAFMWVGLALVFEWGFERVTGRAPAPFVMGRRAQGGSRFPALLPAYVLPALALGALILVVR